MTMLEIEKINCFYGNVQVLWDVSLKVGEAEIVALLGANGAGKTTLLNAVTGLMQPASGHVRFMGQSLDGVPSYSILEKGIAYLPEGGTHVPRYVHQGKPRNGRLSEKPVEDARRGDGTRFRAVSEAEGTAEADGVNALWRRKADACHGARPDVEPEALPF